MDFDSSKNAYTFFKVAYKNNNCFIFTEFDFDNPLTYNERKGKPKSNDRYLVYVKSNSNLTNTLGNDFSLSGDCFFNFNYYKKRKYTDIIDHPDINDDKKILLKNKLSDCCKRHHSYSNIVLFPTTGALNSFKGKVYFKKDNSLHYDNKNFGDDRPDTFLYCLNEYFVNKDEFILSASIFTNKPYIENFLTLNEFDDIFMYCDKMLFIKDKNFISKLIDNGKNDITSAEDLNRYMDLAIEYWEIRNKSINNLPNP